MITKEEALLYHKNPIPGKIEVIPTKSTASQKDLALAYTPGVAEPCREIHKDPDAVFKYTAKGNLVAVISNGSAVLGLGNIGAAAGKPVMEGKGVLFKRFANIDVFDIELDTQDPDEIIRTVKLLEPTFGGINLEDIKAPECFYIEEELKKQMNIPVFHDDQHGTAIISGAGLLNAAEIVEKKMQDLKVVVNGAGAAAVACAKFYMTLGVKKENLIMCDSKGVIYVGRKKGMNPVKEFFGSKTEARSLSDALKGADVFAGMSIANVLGKEMVRTMADDPIILAMANPDPEISYEDAKAARDDVIIATGRSDYPNQVNNVLGFPFIFRGALDVRATTINEEMKIAAAQALADLAKEPVPYSVMHAYRLKHLEFGRDYIIPKPFDPRVLIWETAAVAKAAMDSNVARLRIDIDEYKYKLEAQLGLGRKVMRGIINKAKKQPKKIVYPEGRHIPILKAAEIVLDEGLAQPILIGNQKNIERIIEQQNLNLRGVEIIEPKFAANFDEYVNTLHQMRQRKGMTKNQAMRQMQSRNYYAAMMVHKGHADGMVAGLTQTYSETIRPALQVIGVREDVRIVAGLNMVIMKDKVMFFGDTTVNIEPSTEDLAEIAILSAKATKRFGVEPRVAMLSFSNFGSTKHPLADKVRKATQIVRQRFPDLVIDGEMQASTAIDTEIIDNIYPFSSLQGTGGANVLIFPNLDASNSASKLLQRLGGAEVIGPILIGMRKPVHVLQIGDFNEVDVVNMTAIAVLEAQAADIDNSVLV